MKIVKNQNSERFSGTNIFLRLFSKPDGSRSLDFVSKPADFNWSRASLISDQSWRKCWFAFGSAEICQ